MSNISSPTSTQCHPPIDATATAQTTFNWRAHLPVHPAAERFPLMSETDPAAFKDLVDDIKVKGLIEPLGFWNVDGQFLLDGRNRLDALAALGLLYETEDHHLGIKKWTGKKWSDHPAGRFGFAIDTRGYSVGDPYAIALSLNVHRRHLNAEQKRDLIAKFVVANPELSDRQLGKMANASKNTAASVRDELESRGQIDHVGTRTDSKGRKQPAKRKHKTGKKPTIMPPAPVEMVNGAAPEPFDLTAFMMGTTKLPNEAGGRRRMRCAVGSPRI
jgi:hypothetical protein